MAAGCLMTGVTLLAVRAGLLAACGDDDDKTETGSGGSSTTTSTSEQSTTTTDPAADLTVTVRGREARQNPRRPRGPDALHAHRRQRQRGRLHRLVPRRVACA